jgi:hypothetical protein
MLNPLRNIKSFRSLYILHLSSGNAEIYDVGARGTRLIEIEGGLTQAQYLVEFAAASPDTPWVILVDQSEEIFWGGVMPVMRGAAKTAWIERMAAQSGTESPYRWFDLQGKSRSHPDKIRLLGYTLGRPEGLEPWLQALKSCDARIRGVYSPVMLTPTALSLLKIKPPKGEDAIAVLVTPHADGLRQTVLVGGRVRFSRLALHPLATAAQWFETVYQETARLREYLIGSGLLKNDRTGMNLYALLPAGTSAALAQPSVIQHLKDQYRWIGSPLNHLAYVAALAKNQPSRQLAPSSYGKLDLTIRITKAIYLGCATVVGCALIYLGLGAMQLWQKQTDIDAAASATNKASQRYQVIAKTYPATPLTAIQLAELSSRWGDIKAMPSPSLRSTLAAAGQTLERHPNMIIEEIQWTAEDPKPTTKAPTPFSTAAAANEPKDIATMVMRGYIRGLASNDLRGTRDALSKFLIDLNRSPNIRAEITKKPLDLSTKAALSGSGKQERSELSFEVKLWQR